MHIAETCRQCRVFRHVRCKRVELGAARHHAEIAGVAGKGRSQRLAVAATLGGKHERISLCCHRRGRREVVVNLVCIRRRLFVEAGCSKNRAVADGLGQVHQRQCDG